MPYGLLTEPACSSKVYVTANQHAAASHVRGRGSHSDQFKAVAKQRNFHEWMLAYLLSYKIQNFSQQHVPNGQPRSLSGAICVYTRLQLFKILGEEKYSRPP